MTARIKGIGGRQDYVSRRATILSSSAAACLCHSAQGASPLIRQDHGRRLQGRLCTCRVRSRTVESSAIRYSGGEVRDAARVPSSAGDPTVGVTAVAPARGSPARPRGSRVTRRRILLLTCAGSVAAAFVLATLLVVAQFPHIYIDRRNLPDLGPFTRFEFSTIGHVYGAGGRPLIELAREYRDIARYEDIPPIVRHAILAAEDKRFFSHNGIDYLSVPRVLGRVR